ncbi:MAG TPA: polysaccharide biosynthesis/export family protein [Paracoccus sp. (in: a-proteobacteria)]|mgnify:CR=1 FL=1|nr:polysaccharide biosynthesis/export family protein [Paracoccus sp. (in: a-proteobacteria)]
MNGILRLAVPSLTALFMAAPAHAQQHTVTSGETLDILVFRVPELTRQAVVDVDGQVAFPPLGQIPVAGQTVDQIAALIQERLAGLEIMLDARVTVGLAAVRPIVIGGDVAQPGAIPHVRGMTVRRAIALAGGLGTLRPSRGAADELRAEREALAAELLDRHARLARARAELDNSADLSAEALPEFAGIDHAAVLALANSLLDAARTESEAQKAFLSRDLEIIEDRIGRLGVQRDHQKALVEEQTAELDRYTDMQKRGLTPQTRVSEEYRTLNELQGRLAETEADIADVGRQRENARHELDRHDARRAAALEAEIQTALTEIASLDARMRGATARLAQLGMSGQDEVAVTLYRVTDGQETPIAADESTVLQPGDLVEVELPDSFFGLVPSASLAAAGHAAAVSAGAEQPRKSAQQRANP